MVAFVQAETSSGVLTDPEPLVALAKRHGCLTVVDAVAALGGVPVEVDRWGIDAVFAATQKCLSCPPGLAPVSFSEPAVSRIRARSTACHSWLMDLDLLLGGWSSGRRTYHYTAPVNALYGLHEGLLLLHEEGLEQVWERHRLNQAALIEGLSSLGLSPLVDGPLRLPQLTPIAVPEGIDDIGVRSRMLREWGIEMGGGLGEAAGKTWRIGLMGYASREDNVRACLRSLESVLSREGCPVTPGRAEQAARGVCDERCGPPG